MKTWKQIREEEDPTGKNHDLTLKCSECGASETCKCSKPKRTFEGICHKCAQKISEDSTPEKPKLDKHIIQVTARDSKNEDPEKRNDIVFKKVIVPASSTADAVEKAKIKVKDSGMDVKAAKPFGIKRESLEFKRNLAIIQAILEDSAHQVSFNQLCQFTEINSVNLTTRTDYEQIRESFTKFIEKH